MIKCFRYIDEVSFLFSYFSPESSKLAIPIGCRVLSHEIISINSESSAEQTNWCIYLNSRNREIVGVRWFEADIRHKYTYAQTSSFISFNNIIHFSLV